MILSLVVHFLFVFKFEFLNIYLNMRLNIFNDGTQLLFVLICTFASVEWNNFSHLYMRKLMKRSTTATVSNVQFQETTTFRFFLAMKKQESTIVLSAECFEQNLECMEGR